MVEEERASEGGGAPSSESPPRRVTPEGCGRRQAGMTASLVKDCSDCGTYCVGQIKGTAQHKRKRRGDANYETKRQRRGAVHTSGDPAPLPLASSSYDSRARAQYLPLACGAPCTV